MDQTPQSLTIQMSLRSSTKDLAALSSSLKSTRLSTDHLSLDGKERLQMQAFRCAVRKNLLFKEVRETIEKEYNHPLRSIRVNPIWVSSKTKIKNESMISLSWPQTDDEYRDGQWFKFIVLRYSEQVDTVESQMNLVGKSSVSRLTQWVKFSLTTYLMFSLKMPFKRFLLLLTLLK